VVSHYSLGFACSPTSIQDIQGMVGVHKDRRRSLASLLYLQEVMLIGLQWLWGEQVWSLEDDLLQIFLVGQFESMVDDGLIIEYLIGFFSRVGEDDSFGV
jgi:hypothetical protein